MKDKVNTIAIVLTKDEFEINGINSISTTLSLKFVRPLNIEQFLIDYKVKHNFAQTLLFYKGKLRNIYLGEIDGDIATGIINNVKGIIEN